MKVQRNCRKEPRLLRYEFKTDFPAFLGRFNFLIFCSPNRGSFLQFLYSSVAPRRICTCPIKGMTQIEAEPLRQSHPKTPKSASFPKGSKSWVLSPMFALVVVGGTRCTPTSALAMDPPTSTRGSAQKWAPRGPAGSPGYIRGVLIWALRRPSGPVWAPGLP